MLSQQAERRRGVFVCSVRRWWPASSAVGGGIYAVVLGPPGYGRVPREERFFAALEGSRGPHYTLWWRAFPSFSGSIN